MVEMNNSVPGRLSPGGLTACRMGAEPRRDDLRCSRHEKNACDRTRSEDREQSIKEPLRLSPTGQEQTVDLRTTKNEAQGLRREMYVTFREGQEKNFQEYLLTAKSLSGTTHR